MSDPRPDKDVADLLDTLSRRIRSDPAWGAGAPAREEPNGLTVFAGPVFTSDEPALGPVDVFADDDAVMVTAETRNVEPHTVHVTLADDTLFIGVGEGANALRRDIRLPKPVDEEGALATFRNGVLDIVLPLRRGAKG